MTPATEDRTNNNDKEIFHVPGYCNFCGAKEGRHEEDDKPKKKKVDNGFYLNIIVGNSIDLTMSSNERYNFKKDYETFKLRVTLVNLVLLLGAQLLPSRPMDAICHFLMVWYYCTLTIRESILMINGSKIHWWWVSHHYLACIMGGIAITWPDDVAYHMFRSQFLYFTAYICLVQQLQYQYQSGCLRRLHALGEGNNMDVTLDGFAGWMFKGLTFLLPFLVFAYIFEFYNSYRLYEICMQETCVWQVPALSLLFFIVGVGNSILVTSLVLANFQEEASFKIEKILRKYPSFARIRNQEKKE